jgi:predicted PurR-regulated permease PerM
MGTTSEHDLDWRDLFHLHAFLSLGLSDQNIERRELVWIKRFFAHRGHELLLEMDRWLERGHCDQEQLEELADRAAAELSTGEKRRFVYNLAQMCKAKGSISTTEYERILDLAEHIGVQDTDADAIIHSVYSVNDTFMAILGLLALGVILYATQVVIVPLIIALFVTMIINKVEGLVAAALSLRRLRWLNKVVAMVLILGVLFGLAMAAVVSGKEIATRVPYYEQRIGAMLEGSPAAQKALRWARQSGLHEQLGQLPIGGTIKSFLGSLVNLLGNFVLVMIFTGFLVFSGGSFTGIMQEMNEKISAYISIKTLISVITGVAVFALCLAFGIDFALFWAILAFLLNYIPSVGAIIATVPPILLSMIQLDSWAGVVLFAVVFIVAQVLLGQVLEPKLMGDKLAVKPVAILLGLIFWGFLWGIPGMLLAAPLMALLRILASYFNFSRSFERLLAP